MEAHATTSSSCTSNGAGGPSFAKPAPFERLGTDTITLDREDQVCLPSPPRLSRASSAVSSHQDRPPMSVIVVSSSSATADLRLGQSSTPSKRERSRLPLSSSADSPFSAPFRLQPRNGAMGGLSSASSTTPGGRGDAARGRKRSAQSMSSWGARDSLLTTKPIPTPPRQGHAQKDAPTQGISSGFASVVSPPKVRSAFGATPPRGKRSLGMNTLLNFQCLSLQSPKRKDSLGSPPRSFASPPRSLSSDAPPNATVGLPPPSLSSSSSSPGQRPTTVANSVGSFRSHQAAATATPSSNNTMPPRSSFTPVYSAASPSGGSMRSYGSGSIGSNTRMNASAITGSAKSSPKIVSLTVLKDRGTQLPARESHARLPPLPGGGMNSLWLSLESSSDSGTEDDDVISPTNQDEDAKMWPPKTVLCRRTSSDSISTVQNSVLSPRPGSNMMSPYSPRSKQDRQEGYASPIQGTPRTPHTPLPRVTLTPRSTCSRRSGQNGNGLPRFPSPSDVDIMDITSPFLVSAADAPLRDVSSRQAHTRDDLAAIQSLFPGSSNSLALSVDASAKGGREGLASEVSERKKAPLPVLDLSLKMDEAARDGSPVVCDFTGGSFMGVHTKSLMVPSRSDAILQAMMEEERDIGNCGLESVSDIDEDEGFILASPGAIEEERFASCQPARQRRRRSLDRFSNVPSSAGPRPATPPCASPNVSNTNLAAMNCVTSSTSLFGMDIAHPPDYSGATSSEARPLPNFAADGVTSSYFAACSGEELRTPGVVHTHNRRKSDSSLASIGLALDGCGGDGGRDLVTPPAMPIPEAPPALSPKEGCFLPVMLPVEAHRPIQTSVCIAGADRRSVTMAIARMAFEAKHHSESSPVL